MKALIDGDVILYGCGFAAQRKIYTVRSADTTNEFQYKKDAVAFMKEGTIFEPCDYELTDRVEVEPLGNAIHNINTKLGSIMENTRANTFVLYLTGPGNFRDELVSDYKANRDPDHKPFHYKAMKAYMIEHLHAIVVEGQEADDAMSIEQVNSFEDTIICTIDKDLKMVPGNHYHFNDNKLFTVSEREGQVFFYKQIITGDKGTDNISGLFHLCKRKATKKILDPLDEIFDEGAMWEYVKSLFVDIPEETIITNARLLWMRREENELWRPPTSS